MNETNTEHLETTSTYNENAKKAIYKWREQNPDKFKEQQKRDRRIYYQKHKEKCKEESRIAYKKKKEELEKYKEELEQYKKLVEYKKTMTDVVQTEVIT